MPIGMLLRTAASHVPVFVLQEVWQSTIASRIAASLRSLAEQGVSKGAALGTTTCES
jgi:hypothetical protein